MLKDILFLAVVFLTNIIQGITGFAGTVLAMPPGIFLQGIDTAKMVLNILGILSSIWIIFISYKDIDWKEVKKILIFMIIGVALGMKLFTLLPLGFLLKIYAFFIILMALKGIFIKGEIQTPKWVLIGVILLAGVVHGMFVSGGPLIMIYVAKKLKSKSSFRATLAVVWIVLNSYLAFSHYNQGVFTPENIKLLWMSIPPFAFGMIAGNILHYKMSQASFLKLSYILLSISGMALIVK
ncbi:sulfite exporter TauE/SafE family protein [Candidatus Cetobacterium colombiensis]|uniref:Probable membrane transporter protein n=1 Tax=Candidatus Cetobacterium colombiensis TaxID=3073100 RepID=A0ABU4WC99_9FUSO|nr:sulfite exporter TauE/SafE family protein [Candidatus Cetobacterium colombiensis]MDX8336128.1 sulfite exporter TauE/SafE family protein [Candidatus Cetobacterium colombiensis]